MFSFCPYSHIYFRCAAECMQCFPHVPLPHSPRIPPADEVNSLGDSLSMGARYVPRLGSHTFKARFLQLRFLKICFVCFAGSKPFLV